MADALAKATARSDSTDPMPNPFDSAQQSLLPWVWYHMMHSLHDHNGSADPNHLCTPCPPQALDADYACWPKPIQHPATGQTAKLNLRMATFNVQTLGQWTNRKTKTWAPRQAILQEQAQNTHVLFLQETRSKTTAVYEDDRWIVFQSQSQAGQGGCAIWLNKKQAVLTLDQPPKGQDKTYWSRDACQVLHSDSRYLIVQVKLPTSAFTLVSAHAPHSCSPESDISTFWSQLCRKLQPHVHTNLIIGVDANARVGTCVTPAIGSFQAEPENFNGQNLRLLCDRLRLLAPTTSHELRWERPPLPGTWKSVSQWHRIDYILVPDSLQHASMTAVTDEFGFDTKQDDHVSVTLHLTADTLVSGQVASSPLRLAFDRASMQTPDGKNKCRHLLDLFHAQHFPSLWLMPVDRQAALMHSFFQTHLPVAFPRKKQSAKAGVLSPSTLQHLTWSRQCRRRTRLVQKHILTSQLRAIMHEWLAQCPRRTQPRTPLYRILPSPNWLKACHLAIAWNQQQVYATRSPLAKSLQADEASFLAQKAHALHDVLASATGDKMWQALRPHLPKQRARVQDLQKRLHVRPEDFAQQFAKIEAAKIVRTDEVMPDNKGEFYILYLYAGSRRYGDTHAWAEHFSALYNCRIRVLAIDIVFNAALCDMMRPASRQFWHRLLADGLFVFWLLMAPPCETWSVARWLSKLRNDHGPVPLRDTSNLWGYRHLTVRQLHQVRVANELLQVSLLFAATATRVGVAWALEHPALPSLDIAASIWKLPQVIRLQNHAHTKTHLILQGLFGGVAAKPTFIMAHALDSLGFLFQFWAACGQSGPMWMPLVGKDSSGNFRTARAKQYPPRLNAVFIEAFCQRMVVLRSKAQQVTPPDFSELLEVLPQLDFSFATTGWEMGPDYAQR
eukprot:Skav223659  [mRNA]  locus=scaffold1275:81814:87091:- [translate_table: standard]